MDMQNLYHYDVIPKAQEFMIIVSSAKKHTYTKMVLIATFGWLHVAISTTIILMK